MKLLPFERDATAQELYERSARRCPWERLPAEAKANWERIARERPAKVAEAKRKAREQ